MEWSFMPVMWAYIDAILPQKSNGMKHWEKMGKRNASAFWDIMCIRKLLIIGASRS
jgi:hypothetical protein